MSIDGTRQASRIEERAARDEEEQKNECCDVTHAGNDTSRCIRRSRHVCRRIAKIDPPHAD